MTSFTTCGATNDDEGPPQQQQQVCGCAHIFCHLIYYSKKDNTVISKTHVSLQSRSEQERRRHRCSDHLNQSRALSGLDISSDMHHSTATPIQHEPHCPMGDDHKSGTARETSSAVATAPPPPPRDPETEGDGKNYRTLCHCEAACK